MKEEEGKEKESSKKIEKEERELIKTKETRIQALKKAAKEPSSNSLSTSD